MHLERRNYCVTKVGFLPSLQYRVSKYFTKHIQDRQMTGTQVRLKIEGCVCVRVCVEGQRWQVGSGATPQPRFLPRLRVKTEIPFVVHSHSLT